MDTKHSRAVIIRWEIRKVQLLQRIGLLMLFLLALIFMIFWRSLWMLVAALPFLIAGIFADRIVETGHAAEAEEQLKAVLSVLINRPLHTWKSDDLALACGMAPEKMGQLIKAMARDDLIVKSIVDHEAYAYMPAAVARDLRCNIRGDEPKPA